MRVMQRRSFSLPLSAPPAVKFEGGRPAFLVVPGLISRRRSFSLAVAGNGDSRLPNWNPSSPSPSPFPFLSTESVGASGQPYYSASAPPPRQLLELKALCFRPSPQLGLLSLLFALSMAIGAIISLAVLSIPTINAFTRLAASINKLLQVVSQEVPGTLSSLKLSGLEINELTLQLKNLRQRISGTQLPKKVRNYKPSSFGRSNQP
ncbi:hypothetical protein F2P56_014942 [Juglans regia]|uniref:Uncharacterized protein LOC109005665 n=2 Tax=Juglans regia TaxID=51240 RepID=A0A2I4G8L9_JUGRE|nr:uncharacterized protein LOC109005665 [Juglans regia]KAF5464904.1 hypothetical protein F2P56_014942 [Juglans regia]